MHKNITALFCVLVACVMMAAPSHAQTAGLMITPLNKTVNAGRGSQVSIDFDIINQSGSSSVVEVRRGDLTQTLSGGADLKEAGTIPRSCANWLTTQEGAISVPSGQKRTLTVRATVPGDAAGSYHAVLVVKLPNGVLPPGMTGGVVTMQTLLPIHIVVNGTEKPAAVVEKAVLMPADQVIQARSAAHAEQLKGKWALVPTVSNTGNTMVRVKGDIVVTSEKGTLTGRYLVAEGAANGQLILPGAQVSFPILIDSTLPDPKYQARLSLAYTDKQGYTMPMSLTPHIDGDARKGEVALGTVSRMGLQAYVEPNLVLTNVMAGGLRSEKVTVTNLEAFPVNVVVKVLPTTIDADGTPVQISEEEVSASWLAVASPSFRIGAQQTRSLTLRLSAPDNAKDQWALVQLDFTSADPKNPDLTSTSKTLVLLRNLKSEEQANVALQGAVMTSTMFGPTLSLSVNNVGPRPAAFATSKLELMPANSNDTTKAVQLDGAANLVVLPDKMRRLDFVLPTSMSPGQYVGRLKLVTSKVPGSKTETTEEPVMQFTLNLDAPAADEKPKTPPVNKSVASPKKPETTPKKPVPAPKKSVPKAPASGKAATPR